MTLPGPQDADWLAATQPHTLTAAMTTCLTPVARGSACCPPHRHTGGDARQAAGPGEAPQDKRRVSAVNGTHRRREAGSALKHA